MIFDIFTYDFPYHCRREQERIDAKKIEVEQLRIEVSVERRPVSEACQELIDYILKEQSGDYLWTGSKELKNPFEKARALPCPLL